MKSTDLHIQHDKRVSGFNCPPMETPIVNHESVTPQATGLDSSDGHEPQLFDSSFNGEPAFDPGFDQEMILEQVLSDQSVTQHWTRRSDDASDTINAWLRCCLAIHQQRFILHLPFVPSFREMPEVTCNLVDDYSGRLRVTDQQKYGVRLELILERPVTEPTAVLIEVTATSPRSHSVK